MKQNDYKNLIDNIPKLQWACRRGMLELDVLLGNFLKTAYPKLSAEEKQAFVKLLDCTDPELFAWLLGHEQPTEAELISIIEIIRRHAHTRL